MDLSNELQAVSENRETLEVSSGRIWLGIDGRVRILGFNTSGDADEPAICLSNSGPELLSFLDDVSDAVLGIGSKTPESSPDSSRRIFVPTRANRILEQLRGQEFQEVSEFSRALSAVDAEEAEVSRRRRILPPLLAWSPVMLLSLSILIVGSMEIGMTLSDPDGALMVFHLNRLDRYRQDESVGSAELEAFEEYVLARFGASLDKIEDLARQNPTISNSEKELAEALKKKYAAGKTGDTKESAIVARRLIGPLQSIERNPVLWLTSRLVAGLGMIGFGAVALGGFLAGLIYPWGVLLRLFGIAVIDEAGTVASRAKATLRNAITWSPGLVCAAWIPSIWLPYMIRGNYWFQLVQFLVIGLCMAIYLAAFGALMKDPDKGLQDRLAGTRLVRR
jgi:hypothetical protein